MKAVKLLFALWPALAACQSVKIPTVLELPTASYSLIQRSDYGQPFPVIDVILKNPYSESICVPASSFDDTIAAIGVKHGTEELNRKQAVDIFPPEFSTRLHGESYYFIAPGRGWRDLLRIKNFDLKPDGSYGVTVKWIFYFCNDLGDPAVGRGEDLKRTIVLEVKDVKISAPW